MLIRTRLILIGLLPVLLFLLFIAGMMVTQLQLDSFREKAVFASHIEKNFFDLFVIAHDMKEKNRFERSRQQWPPITRGLGQQLSEARKMFSSTDESELVEILLEYFEDSQRDFLELTRWLDQHQGRTLNAAQQDYLSSQSERLHISLQSAIPIASRIAAINQRNAVAFDKKRENALVFALVFIAGVLLLILWPLMRGIARSVEQLKTGMNRAALGNLESHIAIAGKDEFAQLARHFNEMASKLSETTVAREKLSAEVVERQRAEKAHKDSEQRFRDIVNSTDGIVWEADASTFNFTFISQQAERLLGYPLEDWLKPGFWVEHLHPDDRGWASEYCASCTHRLGPHDFEYRFIAQNGHTVWLRDLIVVVAEDGIPRWLRGIMLDITDRKEHEEELKRSNAELEQFSYAVSHDMRQPLRMISSYLQLLELKLAGQLDGEKRDYFDFAIEGAKRIDQMLVELLEYSRIGRMGEPPTLIDSRALLDEALQFLQPAIAEAQAKVNIAGEWPHVLICHDEILRVLQNLIGNAIKFRVAGRIPEITVTSETIKNEWHLSVADNGVGIIPDQIKRLFQVFQRLQSREAYEGTGIGLALCRKIAEHHKGRIWAESEGEGRGSRFYVALPVLRDGQR